MSTLDPCVFPSQVVVGGAVEEYQRELVIMLWRAGIVIRIQLMHGIVPLQANTPQKLFRKQIKKEKKRDN
jgi:hypothetical protein